MYLIVMRSEAEAEASYVAGFPRLRLRLRLVPEAEASYVAGSPVLRLRLRLVTPRRPPYPSRSPRAHPSGWTRTQGLSRTHSSVSIDTLAKTQLARRRCLEPVMAVAAC